MDTYFIEKNIWADYIRKKSLEINIYAAFEKSEPVFSNESQFIRADKTQKSSLMWEIANPDNIDKIIYDRMHPVAPLKIFFFPFKEIILPEIDSITPFFIIGATNCDLLALDITDKVFKDNNYKDPSYSRRRQQATIISIDCQKPDEYCFCELWGNRTYPEKNFDLNLTYTSEGFIAEIGSEKGVSIIKEIDKKEKTSEETASLRESIRKQTQNIVKNNNSQYKICEIGHIRNDVPSCLENKIDSPEWKSAVTDCVQCGACNAACPTCVCFLLEDFSSQKSFTKAKIWDYCLYQSYAKMASGVSPRPLLWERYANRLLCKYQYMVKNFGIVGCTGCGRCIAGCPGKIDKRKILQEVAKQ
jgi:ferredoxin